MKIPIGTTKTLFFSSLILKEDYTVHLYLRNNSINKIKDVIYSAKIDGNVNGTTIKFVIKPLVEWEYGLWQYHVVQEKDENTELLESGEICILPPIKVEPRKSQTQIDYETVNEAIRNYGESTIQSYTIAGRQVNKLSLSELYKMRSSLLRQLNHENNILGLPTIQTGISKSFRIRGVY